MDCGRVEGPARSGIFWKEKGPVEGEAGNKSDGERAATC